MDYPDSPDLFEGKFTDGDPVAGRSASVASADHMNAVYDELINVITFAGVTPAAETKNQLKTALEFYRNASNLNAGTVPIKRLPTTSSPTDTTPNMLLKVGDFGVGSNLDLRGSVYSSGTPEEIYGTGVVAGFADGIELGIQGSLPEEYGSLTSSAQYKDVTGLRGVNRVFVGTRGIFYQTAASPTVWGEWLNLYSTASNATAAEISAGLIDDKPITPKSLNDSGITSLASSQFGRSITKTTSFLIPSQRAGMTEYVNTKNSPLFLSISGVSTGTEFGSMEISTDGGATWVVFLLSGRYESPGSSSGGVFVPALSTYIIKTVDMSISYWGEF